MGFKLKGAKDIEEAVDTVGSGGALDSGIYPTKLKNAYVHIADSGAQAMNIEVEVEGGRTQRHQLWVSNKDGEIFYTDSNGKKKYMGGFLIADALAMLATGGEAGIQDLETEEKILAIYDFDKGQDVNKKVEAFVDLFGLEFQAGIIKHVKPKKTKVGDEYVESETETITVNELDKVFSEEGFTTIELMEEAEEPDFIHKWLARWEGKEKTSKPKAAAKGRNAAGGRSGARTGAAKPAAGRAGSSGAAKKSFFNKK